MRRFSSQIGSFAGGLAAIAATAGILLSGAAAINGRTTGSEVDFVLETPETPDFETEETTEEDIAPIAPDAGVTLEALPDSDSDDAVAATQGSGAGKSARQAAPDSFSLPDDVQSQPLERIEPGRPAPEDEKKTTARKTSILPRPLAVSSGEIGFGDRTIQLEGVSGLPLDKTCTDPGGANWPCGMMARTALRNFIGGRALTCAVPETGWTGRIATSCSLSGRDVGLWLVESGWAQALPGSGLEQRQAEAEAEKRGAFGADPRRGPARAPVQEIELP